VYQSLQNEEATSLLFGSNSNAIYARGSITLNDYFSGHTSCSAKTGRLSSQVRKDGSEVSFEVCIYLSLKSYP
jgi:hypothetical protein